MLTVRNNRWIIPAFGILAAIATNTALSFTVLAGNGAFALLPLLVIFIILERPSLKEIGLVWGQVRHYLLALLHPVFVLSLLALAAWAAGATNFENTDWSKAALDFAFLTLITIPAALITEEGFFRGWLWSSLRRSGLNEFSIILLTGIAFGLWHLPYALLVTGFDISSAQLPLYILNASLVGVLWGMLRFISGSVIVASVTHGLWNGAVYVFFNSGTDIGALGIQETAIYGPEVGLLGLGLNLVVLIGLWLWYRRTGTVAAANSGLQPRSGAQSQDVI